MSDVDKEVIKEMSKILGYLIVELQNNQGLSSEESLEVVRLLYPQIKLLYQF
ncbi:MAG: hypothetical protein KAS32_26060 [Candidatus Peribacteraceae bacterium]|nr:hypothetical protein [Candidatus Peribacteraceae bacterium]